MSGGVDRDELRALVRQVLKESIGSAAGAEAKPQPGGFPAALREAMRAGDPARVRVSAASGTDLEDFARSIAQACEQPELKTAIMSGRIRFEPSGKPDNAVRAQANPPARQGSYHMTDGVLSEARVVEIGRSHERIVIGADVVLTPLAKDKAREIKLELVRQKP